MTWLQSNSPVSQPITVRGFKMSVVTRLSNKDDTNIGFEIRDSKGRVLVVVETVSHESELRISSVDDVEVVKSNGVKLRRRK